MSLHLEVHIIGKKTNILVPRLDESNDLYITNEGEDKPALRLRLTKNFLLNYTLTMELNPDKPVSPSELKIESE